MTTARAYCRCNGGHYFIGEYCPYDGWSSAASKELMEATEQLEKLGKETSIEELRSIGVSNETLWRTIVISFGTNASIFEALSPASYVVKGEAKPPHKFDLGFK
jgi:hypothetical protein